MDSWGQWFPGTSAVTQVFYCQVVITILRRGSGCRGRPSHHLCSEHGKKKVYGAQESSNIFCVLPSLWGQHSFLEHIRHHTNLGSYMFLCFGLECKLQCTKFNIFYLYLYVRYINIFMEKVKANKWIIYLLLTLYLHFSTSALLTHWTGSLLMVGAVLWL